MDGTPVAYRARKAIQYSDNIGQVVENLATKNNGLYTNEWLIADAKNNEIAMFELGTYKTKLWRSSKEEWFHGAEGFYWGCNNTKDLEVRLEYEPDPQSAPTYVPYVPESRDLKWQELYTKYKGKIDEQFGFLAFQTAPLVTSTSMDAKIATADLASRMMLWAVFGKPNQREWAPSPMQKEEYAKNDGLYPGGYKYRLIAAEPSDSLRASIGDEKARLESKSAEQSRPERGNRGKGDGQYADKLWKGWLLPTSDADTWFTAGSAVYYQDLRSGDVERAMAAHWAMYRESMLAEEPNESQRYQIALYKGAIFLDSLRRGMGDDRFFEVMGTFYAANTHQAGQRTGVSGCGLAPPPSRCRRIRAVPSTWCARSTGACLPR